MTVVVSFWCSDGIVVASDSMLTPSLGEIGVGHHEMKKIYVLDQEQLFAFSGDPGLAARLRQISNRKSGTINNGSALDYALTISQEACLDFQSTGVWPDIDLGAILAFVHGGAAQCCVFENRAQPRLLDADHYFIALGNGKLAADPFLRFLSAIFCKPEEPLLVKDAVFLATWTLEHVIATSPGGIAGPIQMATLEAVDGTLCARLYAASDIGYHSEAIRDAERALQEWSKGMRGATAAEVPTPPTVTPPTTG